MKNLPNMISLLEVIKNSNNLKKAISRIMRKKKEIWDYKHFYDFCNVELIASKKNYPFKDTETSSDSVIEKTKTNILISKAFKMYMIIIYFYINQWRQTFFEELFNYVCFNLLILARGSKASDGIDENKPISEGSRIWSWGEGSKNSFLLKKWLYFTFGHS